MFGFHNSSWSESGATIEALDRSLAIIEFDPNGKIILANDNFCNALGYTLAEITGQHHSMFVEPEYVRSSEYKSFWAKLASGQHEAREYKRVAKGGKEIWIQASYYPVKNAKGEVLKVVKVATVITDEKLKNAEFGAKIEAISRAQAVIEFTPSGEIITANENFLSLLGYHLDEVKGKHHRIFVEPTYVQSPDYQEFWRKLNSGEYVSASFKRIGKGGKEVWIQASYNPIFDLNKKVTKIVKFASDITDLTEIAAGLSRMAANNLALPIQRVFSPTFESLRANFNASLDKLRSTMVDVADSTDTINSGVKEISTASDQLSRRTEQQAASLEETAAALDEITATMKKSAEGAQHARQTVAAADEDAKKGSSVVLEAIGAMDAIAKSAQQISQIISVIDEIAFQTNLLALNAGVEAARAGDAGRGFAVVASEVRALAQRSAEAAKEIKSLILASSTQVDTGVKLVKATGTSLEKIMNRVAEINTVIGDIAVGAQEQAVGLQQVNQAINQMDQMTQENAAMAEESNAASHSLSDETDQLSNIVGQFDLGRDGDSGSMRHELKKAAPHAFRPSVMASAGLRLSLRERQMRTAGQALKVVANGSSVGHDADWEDM